MNVVLAPAFVWLYEHYHSAPFIICAVMMLAMLAYAFRDPQLRNAPPAARHPRGRGHGDAGEERRGRRGLMTPWLAPARGEQLAQRGA